VRPDARLPRIAATFLEEDSNGWLVTFSDLVLQLFAFVMVAAVLGTSSVTSPSAPATSPARAYARPSAPRLRALSEIPAPPTADALSLARFDDLPPRPAGATRTESVASIPAAPPVEAVEVNLETVMAAKATEAPGPARSLATELESFVVAEGLEDAVQVAVNGGGVTLSISDTIGFASGRAELLPDASPVLAEVRGLVGARPDLVVEVSGHTDDRPLHTGAFWSNLDLSLARAARVAHELAADDAELTGRIFAAGYGAARPVAPNDDAEGRARNRRVELRLVPGRDVMPVGGR
jgi:chemotaxis protein MotB